MKSNENGNNELYRQKELINYYYKLLEDREKIIKALEEIEQELEDTRQKIVNNETKARVRQ